MCRRGLALLGLLLAGYTFSRLTGADDGAPPSLSAVPCDTLNALRVFSHCGLSGEGNGLPESAIVTEASFLATHRLGVAHFDMDLFFTEDGTQFVSHPVRLGKALGVEDVFSLSPARLAARVAAAAPGRGTVLPVSRLLALTAALAPNVTLALDLKGEGRPGFRRQLEWLHGRVVELGLQRAASVWVRSAALAAKLRRSSSSAVAPVRLGKPLMDVGAPQRWGTPDCAAQVETADEDAFDFLGPSRKCANGNLLGASATRRWLPHRTRRAGYLVWVVDTAAELAEQAKMGVDQVISNYPIQLQAAVQAARLYQRCDG